MTPPAPDDGPDDGPEGAGGGETLAARPVRKQVLLRLDPAVHDALASWAAAELRSTNAQIEFLLRRALAEAGRLPSATRPLPRRGRPPKPSAGT
ncbi:hypothetical protein [Streptomyces sp. CBMA29]|uniref:hypothetical protein n=1 Tax=Streptomyces sp. CBMA29 TaxID=1896314 RepID=UPI002948BCB0|nr:hypothetical protein [Streptomyces sp. CBMA29]MBD0739168.1 hypothetical protein [Streptomyces sp. CBMA29]